MDPKLIESAAGYLAALLGVPGAELRPLAVNLINARLLIWNGGHSFSIDRESPALVSMCPALLSNESLRRIGTPEALRAWRLRMLSDPDLQSIDSPGELAGGCFGLSPTEMADMGHQIDASLAAGLPAGAVPSEGENSHQKYMRLMQGESNRRAATKANVHGVLQGNLTDFQTKNWPPSAA